ncbi:hypothetical protein [Roseovarius sp. SCSIO 43702]|uniref:hypothetical protein n=1 Tax=Roseovarius sp. SCSIO 43702 TaxID=2823043 RepID=UPI0021760778|nr:hypothetical protein [Roseovarius sp. SCSIO 43702]
MIVFDDSRDSDPEVDVESDAKDPSRQHVLLNGERIAMIHNGFPLDASHINLLARSVAQDLMAG